MNAQTYYLMAIIGARTNNLNMIYDNLKKAMAYIISVHIPIAGCSLIPILLQWPATILYPVHIVFMELIIGPSCSIVFEQEKADADIMNRRPRDPNESLFNKKMLSLSLLQGLFSLIIVLVVFKTALGMNFSPDSARALTFVTLITSNVGLIITNRSWTNNVWRNFSLNNALISITSGAILFMGLALYTNFISKMFRFTSLSWLEVSVGIAIGLISVTWFEVLKFCNNKFKWEIL